MVKFLFSDGAGENSPTAKTTPNFMQGYATKLNMYP